MRPSRFPGLLRFASAAACLLVFAVGCGKKEDAQPQATPVDSTRAGGPLDSSASPFWYDRARLLDVDGDGVKDSVRLYAIGTNPDSVRIHLVFRSNGRTLHEESWRGGYVLLDPPENVRTVEERGAYLRARLDETLADVRLDPFDPRVFEVPWENYCMESPHACISLELKKAASEIDWEKVPQGEYGETWQRMEAMPVDSAEVRAIISGILERKLPNLELNYGYETHLLLAWDPQRKRFWTLTACC